LAAQQFAQRGFVEAGGTLYPQTAPNDAVQGIAELHFQYESFFRVTDWLRLYGAVDAWMDSYGHIERTFRVDWSDRSRKRPALSIRRLNATVIRGRLTLDLGKQFIRWGKADILNPTDRFAPRDFLSVVENDFLAVTGARLTFGTNEDLVQAVWVPRMTPSRIPLYDGRWTAVPEPIENLPLVDDGAEIPTGHQFGARWSHLAAGYEFSLSYYDGFNHLPLVDGRLELGPEPGIGLRQSFPRIRMAGADMAWQLPAFTLKGEVGYFSAPDGDTDEYLLYVIQVERQSGELFVVAGYAGEVVTVARLARDFAPDRGIARAFLGRASYTIDINRSVAVEAAVRHNGDGGWVKGEYSQAVGGHWRFTLTGSFIRGEPDDFIGQYRRNSNVILTARYSF
jgi:hypothetical protein